MPRTAAVGWRSSRRVMLFVDAGSSSLGKRCQRATCSVRVPPNYFSYFSILTGTLMVQGSEPSQIFFGLIFCPRGETRPPSARSNPFVRLIGRVSRRLTGPFTKDLGARRTRNLTKAAKSQIRLGIALVKASKNPPAPDYFAEIPIARGSTRPIGGTGESAATSTRFSRLSGGGVLGGSLRSYCGR
jgi:hypothetical protein